MRYTILVALLAIFISRYLQYALSGFTSEQIAAVLEIKDRHLNHEWARRIAILEEE